MSLANMPHLCILPPHSMPWILGLDLTAITNVSIAITKRSGDRGHACLSGFAEGLMCDQTQCQRIEYKALIRLRNFGPQFHFSSSIYETQELF